MSEQKGAYAKGTLPGLKLLVAHLEHEAKVKSEQKEKS